MTIEPYENQGGCSFPQHPGTGNLEEWRFGMSLRDYFAAKAMQSLIVVDIGHIDETWVTQMTTVAYRLADAMLREREKGEVPK